MACKQGEDLLARIAILEEELERVKGKNAILKDELATANAKNETLQEDLAAADAVIQGYRDLHSIQNQLVDPVPAMEGETAQVDKMQIIELSRAKENQIDEMSRNTRWWSGELHKGHVRNVLRSTEHHQKEFRSAGTAVATGEDTRDELEFTRFNAPGGQMANKMRDLMMRAHK